MAFRYRDPAPAAELPRAGTLVRLRCRCGQEWQGTARYDDRLLLTIGPELPATASPPCPKCHQPDQLAAVLPCS